MMRRCPMGALPWRPAPPPAFLRGMVAGSARWTGYAGGHAFERALLRLCTRIVAGGGNRALGVRLALRLDGSCPATHQQTVLRAADELVSNAMEHGLRGRTTGHVRVDVVSRAAVGVQISVADDGAGFAAGPIIAGNGFHLLRELGDLIISAPAGRSDTAAVVSLIIPLLRHDRIPALAQAGEARRPEERR